MFLNRVQLSTFLCGVVSIYGFSLAWGASNAALAAQSKDAKAGADQEILKMNAECNAAELRGDVRAMDDCETSDFTHTHANGTVEHKADYLKGIESGAHKFLALDLSDLHVRSYGSAAIVDAHLHLKANNGGHLADVNDTVTIVWVNQQGKWREAAWISHRVAENATPPGTGGDPSSGEQRSN